MPSSDEQTRQLILEKATAIWLDADIDVLVGRVSRRDGRPLLKGKNPREVLTRLAEERGPFYAQAPIRVEEHRTHRMTPPSKPLSRQSGHDQRSSFLGERAATRCASSRACSKRAGEILEAYASKQPFVIVTDENVAAQPSFWTLYNSLSSVGPAPRVIKVPAGEATKSWAQLEALTDQLIEFGVGRSDHIIAFGGGVIGDLVGFAASVVKRGCNFIQIPTTLLAQVDSSVGGKTAINSHAGKNLIGAFHQPALVLIDPDTLDTLPPRETRAGYAEVAKYGLIDDAGFFAWCEANGPALLKGSGSAREHAIAKSVAAKAAIVSEDERETTGRRALLNLGHTFGHALEAETGFSDRLLHGEGVAAGMALAFAYSARRGECPPEDAARVAAHLRAVGLPASLFGRRHRRERRNAGGAHAPRQEDGGRHPALLARARHRQDVSREKCRSRRRRDLPRRKPRLDAIPVW